MTKSHSDQVYFRPRNWAKFQSQSNNHHSWSKLWHSILDDEELAALPDSQQLVAYKLIAVFGRLRRPLPWSSAHLRRTFGSSSRHLCTALEALKSIGFIELCDRTDDLWVLPDKKKNKNRKDTLATLGTSPDGEPPGKEFDPAKQLFDFGVELLASYGIKGQKARALIGKWRKVRKDPDLMAILLRAGETRRFEIVPFIEGSLRDQVKRPRSWVEQEREASRQRMDWIRQEAGIDESDPISGDSAERDSFSGGTFGANEGKPLSPDRERFHNDDRQRIPGPGTGGSGNGDAELFGNMAEDDLADAGPAYPRPNGSHAENGCQADRGAGQAGSGTPRFKAPAVKPGSASD